MEKLNSLNDGMFQKKYFKKEIKKNKTLIIFSYFLIILVSFFVFNIYKKHIELLNKLNQLENNINHISKYTQNKFNQIDNNITQTSKDSEDNSKEIKQIKESMRDYALHIDEQKIDNKNINKQLEEIENQIEFLKSTIKQLKSIIDEKFKNEIVCKYEIKDVNKEILLFNYENEMTLEQERNNKEEIEQNMELYLNEKQIKVNNLFQPKKPGIYTIKIKFIKPINNIRKLFYDCQNLIYVDLTNFLSIYLTDISYLFSKCTNLKEIKGLNKLNTKNIQNMEHLFSFCENLKSIIGFNSFIAYNVYYMNNMFDNCKSLEFLDLTNFDTSNVRTLQGIFKDCESLKEIQGINKFNTNNVIDFSFMFSSCKNLEFLDVSNFNTTKADNFKSMFHGCISLKDIKGLDKLNTSNIVNFGDMFSSCAKLTYLDLSNFDTRKAEYMNGMFQGCIHLRDIKGLTNFITDNVKFMNFMFFGCEEIENLDLSGFNTSKVQSFMGMFMDCVNLKTLNLSNFEILTSNVDLIFQNVKNGVCKLISNDDNVKKLFYKLRIVPWQGLSNRDIP